MRKQIIVTAVLALAVTSCQKKATGQTVAIVNGEEITASDLNSEIASDQNGASTDSKQARNAALENLISRKLLVQQAKADGIDKSPEFVTRLRRGTDDLLINMLVSRKVSTSEVPTPDQITQFEASHPEAFAGREIWSLSQIVYPVPKDSNITARLNGAKTLEEIAQILTSAGIQFSRADRKVDTGVFPDAIYKQISKLQSGEPFIANGGDKAVASVITSRTPNPTPAEQARPLVLNLIKREQTNQAIQERVKSLRASAKIEYQPGFGPVGK